MPCNINTVGRVGDKKQALEKALGQSLTAHLVDDLFLNRDFLDWDDLQARVKGIGPKSIDKLQKHEFIISPSKRRGPAPAPAPTRNLNDVPRANSIRQTSSVTEKVAQRIVDEHKRQHFNDWADLEERVYGLGPAKIEELKQHFCIKPCNTQPEGEAVSGEDKLRLNVADLREATWRRRGDEDMYTLDDRKTTEAASDVEVDHVWECQVLGAAQNTVMQQRRCTRNIHKTLQMIVNSTTNLNCTTHAVNQAKKGPFTKWLKEYARLVDSGSIATRSHALGAVARSSDAGKALIDSGYWANVESSVVQTYEDMEKDMEAVNDDATATYLGKFAEELNEIMRVMAIQ